MGGTLNTTGTLTFRRDPRRLRHGPGQDHPPRVGGPGLTRPDPAPRRRRDRVLRADGAAARRAHVRRLVRLRPGARVQPGAPAQHGRRPDHRLPLRARPRDPHLDHGRHGQGCRERDPVPQRGGARAAGLRRGRRHRQDRHPHRGQAAGHGHGPRRASPAPRPARRSCSPWSQPPSVAPSTLLPTRSSGRRSRPGSSAWTTRPTSSRSPAAAFPRRLPDTRSWSAAPASWSRSEWMSCP